MPTWAETDACLRWIQLPFPRRLAIVMRYTGLRLEQAVMIYREDFDLEAATLLVRKGKSRREQALQRRVPVSRHLIADLGPWLAEHPDGALFPDATAVDGEGSAVPMRSYRSQTRYVTEAWEAATEEGECRREVWAPPSRKKARPDHAVRATLQAALEEMGHGEAGVDWLVEHAPKTTRGKHYARQEKLLCAAVEAISAVDWGKATSNVVPMRRARS